MRMSQAASLTSLCDAALCYASGYPEHNWNPVVAVIRSTSQHKKDIHNIHLDGSSSFNLVRVYLQSRIQKMVFTSHLQSLIDLMFLHFQTNEQ